MCEPHPEIRREKNVTLCVTTAIAKLFRNGKTRDCGKKEPFMSSKMRCTVKIPRYGRVLGDARKRLEADH